MPDRLILAIETSNPASGKTGAGVALLSLADDALTSIGVEWLRPTGRHEDDLMPAIDRLVRRVGAAPGDIARVAVSIGPGGYTGLRVAVTTASMIAQAVGAQCLGVPTAEALILRAGPTRPAAVCLAVKGSSLWVQTFPGTGGGSVTPTSEFGGLGIRMLIADDFLPRDVREWAERAGVEVEPPRYDPTAVAEAALACRSQGPVLPLYAREPEAVTRWRTRDA